MFADSPVLGPANSNISESSYNVSLISRKDIALYLFNWG